MTKIRFEATSNTKKLPKFNKTQGSLESPKRKPATGNQKPGTKTSPGENQKNPPRDTKQTDRKESKTGHQDIAGRK